MIRLTFLWLVILGILGYSWKDWYRGICGLIVLMAVIEHPDMPKSILGIPGLNPWNLLLFNGILAWLSQRRKEGLRFDLPRKIVVMLILFLCVVVIGFVRIIGDTSILTQYYREGMTYFFTEYMVNTIKWVIPGLLLFDGCRTEERFRLAVLSILAVFVLLSIQVAKWMPPTYAVDAEALERRSLKVLVSGIGYHRVNLSAMLSGASWAILCTTVLIPRGKRWIAVFTALFVVYAQMMTGGRAGYGAWVAVGIVMCVLKWRRYLLLIPTAVVLAALVLPGVVGRATEGFTADTHDTNKRLEQQRTTTTIEGGEQSEVDSYTVTAGRSLAWPLVIDKIRKRPLIGYGRQAMLRTGIATYLYDTLGEIFPHPHNAYLEMLLDNGIIGFTIVLSFYALMLFYSISNFLDRESPTCSAIGGVSTALMLGLLVSAMGSQTFYPREGWDGMWAAMLIGLRVRLERQRRAAEKVEGTSPWVEPSVQRSGFAFPGKRGLPDGGLRPPGLQPAPALSTSVAPGTPASRRAAAMRPASGAVGHFRPRGSNPQQAASAPLHRTPQEPVPAGGPVHRAARPLAPQRPTRPSFGRPDKSSAPEGLILHSGWLNAGVTDPFVWKWA